MPYNFTGQKEQTVAKLGVVSDGETFTVADGYGHAVTSTLAPWTAFSSNPTRSATGVWSVTMKDTACRVLGLNVQTLLASGHYLDVQLQPTTTSATGRLVLNWTFNVAGTPTDLPSTGSPQFLVHVVYSESST